MFTTAAWACARGVRFHFGASVTAIEGEDGMVLSAHTDDGDEYPAHAVLVKRREVTAK